jgi:hypothetical protein
MAPCVDLVQTPEKSEGRPRNLSAKGGLVEKQDLRQGGPSAPFNSAGEDSCVDWSEAQRMLEPAMTLARALEKQLGEKEVEIRTLSGRAFEAEALTARLEEELVNARGALIRMEMRASEAEGRAQRLERLWREASVKQAALAAPPPAPGFEQERSVRTARMQPKRTVPCVVISSTPTPSVVLPPTPGVVIPPTPPKPSAPVTAQVKTVAIPPAPPKPSCPVKIPPAPPRPMSPSVLEGEPSRLRSIPEEVDGDQTQESGDVSDSDSSVVSPASNLPPIGAEREQTSATSMPTCCGGAPSLLDIPDSFFSEW